MPLTQYCFKMNEIQFWNCWPKLVHWSQWQPHGVVTQHGMTQNLVFLKMCNFDIHELLSGFGAILGDPKFGSFHVGSPHHVAVTGHSWLTLVGNSNNELCSPSNNTVSKAFWQKKVLPEQRISYCEGIYNVQLVLIIHFGYVSNETNEDVRMYTCRIYSSRYLDTLLHKVELNSIGRMLVYIHSQQRIEKCENCS